MHDFPQPVYLTPASPRWALSSLEKFENTAHGAEHPHRESADDFYLSKSQVARRYGVDRRTIERWSAGVSQQAAA